ncbi:MAG: integral rane protein [Microbacteriaceae bacterium]|nr:integral rane protein [Microbacteriaceae bacterium]
MTENTSPSRLGVGRVLVAVYGILAIAATGRSVFQIIDRFHEAPLAFSLSAVSAVVYIVATIALVAPGRTWYRVAVATIGFELAGVLVIGTISLVAPGILGLHSANPFGREATVWSAYGAGYLLVPLVLPVLGLLYLRGRRNVMRSAA